MAAAVSSHPQPTAAELRTIFAECRQCGSCCKRYSRVLLAPDEVAFIKKMGGHVGTVRSIPELIAERRGRRSEPATPEPIYMLHPDERGCVFLRRIGEGRHRCAIYNYRPHVCRRFKCNLADSSMMQVLGDPICLLGLDSCGRKLEK
jgi:Fe-S-cluster containining protein